MATENLIGKKYNRWTVLNFDEEKSTPKRKYWICQCECGTIKSVRSDQLKSNHSKSCGCLNKDLAAQRMREVGKISNVKYDLTGNDFGYWHVDSRAENQNGHVAWNCTCKCGTKRIVLGQSLKNGSSMSCGCLNMSHGEYKILNLLLNANIPFVKEYVIPDLYFKRENNKCRFDFFINNHYAIEFDGEQHFIEDMDRSYFKHGIEEIKILDNLKNEYCKQHNIPLIRIPYTHLNQLCLEDLLLETSQFIIKEE